MQHQRKIEDIVSDLKRGKEAGRGCTLLIGSGCSVKAGIPTGSGFVEIIQEEYPREYARAAEKTYPSCMAELSPGERRDLITRYVDKAKINWAHICIAQLMKEGYISRVLTTNFDPLVIRACALLGFFPAVYDFATSGHFKATVIPDKAVFYLHGQHTGFVLLNTDEECRKHSESLVPVFQEAEQGRLWLVVGYSGQSDTVFEHLTKVKQFEYGLYWICRRDEPPKHIRDGLLTEDKHAFYLGKYNADDFFVRLTQYLGCFPEFVSKPFSHYDKLLSSIAPYTMPGQETEKDVTERAREHLKKVIEEYEIGDKTIGTDSGEELIQYLPQLAEQYLMTGEYEKLIALQPVYEKGDAPELGESISWAYIMQGNNLLAEAETRDGVEADKLFEQAYEKYKAAVGIKPDSHEALYNWGNALAEQADTKTGEDAVYLCEQAINKFKFAIEIEPNHSFALGNCGATLLDLAKMKEGQETVKLFDEAKEMCIRAESVLPGSGAYNLACINAMQGQELECREWLEKWRDTGHLPPREHIEKDSDLESVRDSDWFKEFLETL